MKKLLFIYNNPLDGSYGGSQRTIQALSGLQKTFEVVTYSCLKPKNKYLTFVRNLFLFSGSLNLLDCFKVSRIIKKNPFDLLFFDVSLHGKLVKKIKKRFPNIKIVVNYHNCEAKYCGDMYKTKGILYYPIYKSAVYNEQLSKQYADYHVFITNEDRIQLGVEKNFCIVPVTLEDKYLQQNESIPEQPYLLFVGAAQYANIEGAKFIIEKLAPKINKRIIIAGNGMKRIFSGNYKNVEIFDFVDSLSDLFIGASAFLSPLFYGSGAKIKVAEALMYGKKIIGTPLSFFGYEIENADCDICCDEDDFNQALNKLDMSLKYYPRNRQLFIDYYSSDNNTRYYAQLTKVF